MFLTNGLFLWPIILSYCRSDYFPVVVTHWEVDLARKTIRWRSYSTEAGRRSAETRGESIAIVLALVGAYPVKEGTGKVVRYDLKPLRELQRPRIDVLASMSGIFRDSFANIVDLLDDIMFERLAKADETIEMNYI
eukprot:scaffold4482_cov200-Chaetoceros_neogracile.AAC.2